MECDSMHAAIEHEKKYVDVFTMLDWISIFGRARRRHPYKVKNFHYEDFYYFQKLAKDTMKNRRRDENGNIINWLLVKSFMYLRINLENYITVIITVMNIKLSQLADRSKIPISQAKHHDLVKLCNQMVIPAEVHN